MCRTCWKPVRDVAASIGIPMYSFSFSQGRFRKIKPLNLNCGVDSADSVFRKYSHLQRLAQLQNQIENINLIDNTVHPLQQLDPSQLPDTVRHGLDMFNC